MTSADYAWALKVYVLMEQGGMNLAEISEAAAIKDCCKSVRPLEGDMFSWRQTCILVGGCGKSVGACVLWAVDHKDIYGLP